MAYQLRVARPLGINAAEVQDVLKTAPKVVLTVQPYMNKAATLAPKVVPILKQLMPLLALGPTLAPLAAVLSKDVSTVLQNAPSYTGTLTEVMDTLAKAPALAQEISAVAGKMATVSQKIGEDPALGVFIDRMSTIITLYEARKARSPSAPAAAVVTAAVPSISPAPAAAAPAASAPNANPGIGLKWVVPWMDRGIFLLQHPVLTVALPAVAVLLIGSIGFGLGRLTK